MHVSDLDSVVLEDLERGIKLLRLNRPEVLNAVDAAMLARLFAALDAVDQDRDCRVLIVTGAGRGFCAGIDLGAFSPGAAARDATRVQTLMHAMRTTWNQLLPRIRKLKPAVIAAVNGPAAGGGFVLALAADIRFAAPAATFHDAFIRVGVSGCELGLSWLLPRLIGAARAFELMLTGRRMGAAEAEAAGLVFRVVAADALLEAALEKAREIATNTPFGVWMTREVMWSALEIPALQAAMDLETRTQVLGLLTEDQREQLRALLETRTPEYRNR
jgi:enoyl-CoA hydratase